MASSARMYFVVGIKRSGEAAVWSSFANGLR